MAALLYLNECKFDCTNSNVTKEEFFNIMNNHNIYENRDSRKFIRLGDIILKIEFDDDSNILKNIYSSTYNTDGYDYNTHQLTNFRDFMLDINVSFTIDVSVISMIFSIEKGEKVFNPVRYLINNDGVFIDQGTIQYNNDFVRV